jgi:hypothetical protein
MSRCVFCGLDLDLFGKRFEVRAAVAQAHLGRATLAGPALSLFACGASP